MKRLRRLIAFLLCFIFLVPSDLVSLASVMPEETLPIEAENILIDPIESEDTGEWDGDMVIYWNPGDQWDILKEMDQSTPSNGTMSDTNQLQHGFGHDGLTPGQAVRSLNTAIRKAEKLSRQKGADIADVKILAMNPMVISAGTSYTVRGQGVRISAWEGREDGSELIFIVDGGILSLSNLIMEPQDGAVVPDEAELLYVKSGTVQLGQGVESYGSFVLDYSDDNPSWEWSSYSDARASASQGSQRKEPVIELLKRFDAASEYLLDLRIPQSKESVMAVDSLYSNTKSRAEFMETFTLVEEKKDWELVVEERIGGVFRDTTNGRGIENAVGSETGLTQKSLIARRVNNAFSADAIYWNPGGVITILENGATVTYPAGNDDWTVHDGNSAEAPVKSFKEASSRAGAGGTIICMQTIDLANDSTDYLEGMVDDYQFVSNHQQGVFVTLWDRNMTPILKITEGVTVTFRNVHLRQPSIIEDYSGEQMVLNQGGEMIFDQNVVIKEGYIQIDLEYENKTDEPPVTVNAESVALNLYFSRLHYDLSWRYHDVVKAAGDLLALGETAAGGILDANIKLELANQRTISEGGRSQYRWTLRPDYNEDQGQCDPSRLELFTNYYYDAIYLNGVTGDNNNCGSSCYLPVKDFITAKAILEREMAASVAARSMASSDAERENISLPTVLYICGTVTIEDVQSWSFPVYQDYDKSPVYVEIRTHINEEAAHDTPRTLIDVKGKAAKLTLGKYDADPDMSEGLLIRSIADLADSYTVVVTDGAALRLEDKAELTGLTDSGNIESRTMGTHILLGKSDDGRNTYSTAVLEMPAVWKGSINGRGIGVDAYGQGGDTIITMSNGAITNNANLVKDVNGNLITDTNKAGIALTDQVIFTMDGGTVSKNKVYSRGAGVYMFGSADYKPVFNFNKGTITENEGIAAGSNISYGIGIYAGLFSTVNMGAENGEDEDCVISKQYAHARVSGGGVFVAGAAAFYMKSGTISGNIAHGGKNYNDNSYGGGISSSGIIHISGGKITGNGARAGGNPDYNYQNFYGAGICLMRNSANRADQIIENVTFADNISGGYTSRGYGGAVYITARAEISGCYFKGNRAYYGGGICIPNTNNNNMNNTTIVHDCTFEDNLATQSVEADASAITTFGYGGAIYINDSVKAGNLIIQGNKAYEGGGIYHKGHIGEFVNCTITKNSASYMGGGVSGRGATTYLYKAVITENNSGLGGGIYQNNTMYLTETVVSGNVALQSGGGIYSTNMLYAIDTRIESNTASQNGGGIYKSGGTFHISERNAGQNSLKDNTAKLGGGLYTNAGNAILNMPNAPIVNKVTGANAQGNNIYITNDTNVTLLDGKVTQPNDTSEGVYSIFLHSANSYIGTLTIDPQKVSIEGDDHVYLSTTNNYLVYLSAAPDENAKLPVDLNEKEFSIGSIVIVPADKDHVEVHFANPDGVSATYNKISFTPLQAADINLNYSNNSKLPHRTWLGGFPDELNPNLTNVVLLAEGVYLRGELSGGDDLNMGTGPTDAVSSYSRALYLLKDYTEQANNNDQDQDGFAPFIYICDNVLVDKNQSWKLEYEGDPHFTTNSKYRIFEAAAGRVAEDPQIKRFASFVNAPMITVNGATLTIDMLTINGMEDAVRKNKQLALSPVIRVEADADLSLLGGANITNNYYNTIHAYGDLVLDGGKNDKNKQVEVVNGDGVHLFGGASMIMNGYSRVVFSRAHASSNFYNIGHTNRGVMIEAGAALTMNADSEISYLPTGTISAAVTYCDGVVIGSAVDTDLTAKLFMHHNARISRCRSGIALEDYDIDIVMDGNARIGDGNDHGIYAYQKSKDQISITLDGEAAISDNQTNGIYFRSSIVGVPGETVKIKMLDKSSISGNGTAGILYNFYFSHIDLQMYQFSKIVNNGIYGIADEKYTHRSSKVSLYDDAQIGAMDDGTQKYGIHYHNNGNSNYNYIGNVTGRYEIYMTGRSMIGGDNYYQATSGRKGNTYDGINVDRPIKLEMDKDSKISYNGRSGPSDAGIKLNKNGDYMSANYRQSGDSTILLTGNASINNNYGYGIISENKIYTSNQVETVYIKETITLAKDNNSTTGPVIKDNYYGVKLQDPESAIYLKQGAAIGQPTNHVDSLTSYAKLYLDGRATIDGRINMRSKRSPITLIHPLPAGSTVGKYELYLAEEFVGKVVVQPDGQHVLDAREYLGNFKKNGADGIAEDKALSTAGINIILKNEDNVYLSGSGNDDNDGRSPATAVRTFGEARRILREEAFDENPNIYICGAVTPLATDMDWSFDPGGTIRNEVSGNVWKPIVYRYKTVSSYLIYLNNHTFDLVLKNITIDGAGDIPAVAKSNDMKSFLYLQAGKATLGEGAVLQNNCLTSTGFTYEGNETLGVFVNTGATFEMDGGIIKDLKIDAYYPRFNNKGGVAIRNQGTVNFKNGVIENCDVKYYRSSKNNDFSSIILNCDNADFTMMAGSIINNTIDPTSANTQSRVRRAATMMFLGNADGAIKGGQIRNNVASRGSAIYYQSAGILELEGGRISGNKSYLHNENGSIGDHSPIYIAESQFQLKGGGMMIDDAIYLDSIQHLITLTGNIYQSNRRYEVFLNQKQNDNGAFGKGSVVVQPDGDLMLNASQFLINFNVHANSYTLDRGQSWDRQGGTIDGNKEIQCLLLMQMVFLDSRELSERPYNYTQTAVAESPHHMRSGEYADGKSPRTAVQSFADAKKAGVGSDPTSPVKDYFIIYFSGPAYPADAEQWDLGNISYMCRYTGFELYDTNGKLVPADHRLPYHNYLVIPKGKFTLGDIKIYGRRAIDSAEAASGDSMIYIGKNAEAGIDGNVTITNNTLLSRNYNIGSYWDATIGLLVANNGKGGAVMVDNGGTLNIEGGTISEVDATFGKAIYQNADENDSTAAHFGHVVLDRSPVIHGDIYLHGMINYAQAYLEVKDTYVLPGSGLESEKLQIRLNNDYSGRPVVKYLSGNSPTEDQIKYYKLDDSINSVYDFGRRLVDQSVLELQLRQLIYLDGQNGRDFDVNYDGRSPDKAFKTVKKVYETLSGMSASAGAMVMIVDTVEVDSPMSLSNEAYIEDNQIHYKGIYQSGGDEILINSQVYFKRYSKPTSTTAKGYTKDTHKGSLFEVSYLADPADEDDIGLTLNGIYLDGHSVESVSDYDYLTAPAVLAADPLVKVLPGARIKAAYVIDESDQPGRSVIPTYTLFSNNKNINIKDNSKKIGVNQMGIDVIEGSGAGIEILSEGSHNGQAIINHVEFRNLELGPGVSGGSDIYQNGLLTILNRTVLTGSVLLEGFGSYGNPDSSRFIHVGAYGVPFYNNFKVMIRDPYNHRKVVEYPNSSSISDGPPETQIGDFILEEAVNRYFALRKRLPDKKYILELIVPEAVYVDGQNGKDETGYGWKPAKPVKSLKEAYKRLHDSGGKAIYIVNTVDIEEQITLSAKTYLDNSNADNQITLLGNRDHVDIRRFVRPVAGDPDKADPSEFDIEFNVPTFRGTLLNIKSGGILTLKDNIYVDGHYTEKTDPEYTNEFRVEDTTETISPLAVVDKGGILNLQAGSVLLDNHNKKELTGAEIRVPGGAVKNDGVLRLSGGKIISNEADQGAGLYQNGTFEIISGPEGLKDQEIYLTTPNSGTNVEPVWGSDNMIETAVLMPDDLALDIQMDHAVAGRPVIKYLADSGVDHEHVHYKLGNTVPVNLFLVEYNRDGYVDDSLLELQDWRILDVEVPTEIFLVVQKDGANSVIAADADTDKITLGKKKYVIKNKGIYDTKVYLSGFVNQNAEAGITDFEVMNLVERASDAVAASADKKDFYLAVKNSAADDGFAGMGELSLYHYAVDGNLKTEMGLIKSKEEAGFEFVAAASNEFFNYYEDPDFPLSGSKATAADRIAHLRNKQMVTGETSANNARAKFKLTYRIELVQF